MTAIIIIFSLIFAAAIIATLIYLSNRYFIAYRVNEKENLGSPKLKIAAIILLALNLYRLISKIINLFKLYPKDWISGDAEEELASAFIRIFSFTIVLLCISFSVFLLKKLQQLALFSSAIIPVLSLFDAIFIQRISAIEAYTKLLPQVAVFLSLIIILASISKKLAFFSRYQKVLKVAPFFLLLNIFVQIFSILSSPSFQVVTVITIVVTILEFVAFHLIFKVLFPLAQASDDTFSEKTPMSKKEKLVLVLSIMLSPLLICLVSSIGKVWLFISLILLAIAIPIVIACTSNSTLRTRTIALTCTFAAVVGLCFLTKITPKNTEKFDPEKCYWCDGYGIYITDSGSTKICSHCHGSGKRD